MASIPRRRGNSCTRGRHEIQDATDKRVDDRYFTQGLLPDICNEHPELTASWDVVYNVGATFRSHTRDGNGFRNVRRAGVPERHFLFQAIGTVRYDYPTFSWGKMRTVGPQYRYGNVLICEKEGFDSLWESIQLQERSDLNTMSCKDVSSTSGRHLLDGLTSTANSSGVFIWAFGLCEFDVTAFKIRHSLTASNRRYQVSSQVTVSDLGLRVANVEAMGCNRRIGAS